MDQYIQHTIQELKGSSEKADQAQGVVLEILLSQNKKLESIEEQTKRTNGRVTILEKQIKPLEEHHQKRKWLQSTIAGATGALVAGVTIIGGFIGLGDRVLAKSPAPEVSENKKEIDAGSKVEKEHTKSKKTAKTIAKDHVFEDPNYYKNLKKCEKK